MQPVQQVPMQQVMVEAPPTPTVSEQVVYYEEQPQYVEQVPVQYVEQPVQYVEPSEQTVTDQFYVPEP